MTKNNVVNHVNEQIQKLHFKMHKKKKQWIVIGISAMALTGGLIGTGSSVFAKSLQKAPKIYHNDLGIKSKYDKGGHGSRILLQHKQDREGLFAQPHFKETSWGRNEGAPYHMPFIFYNPDGGVIRYGVPYSHGYKYDVQEIGPYHGQLEYGDLQKGSGATNVMRVVLTGRKPPRKVQAYYPNAARVATPHKHKDGSISYSHSPVSVIVRADGIQYYKPWRGERSIVFSHNLAHGLYYNGIKNMNIQYIFLRNNKPVQLNHSYMEFHHINGLGPYHHQLQHTQDASVNNEKRVQAIDGFIPQSRGFDHTGETVTPNKNGETPYKLSNHTTLDWLYGGSSNNIFNRPVIGGEYNTTGKGDVRSLLMSLSGSYADINAGSAVGYGSYHPDTDIKTTNVPGKKHPKKPKPTPGSHSTPIHKYITYNDSNNHIKTADITDEHSNKYYDGIQINKRNQQFDYHLTGKIPTRVHDNSYHLDPQYTQSKDYSGFFNSIPNWEQWMNTDPNSFFKAYDSYNAPMTNQLTGYKKDYYDGHSDDHYNLTDNLPKDVRVNGGDYNISNSIGAPVYTTWSGDHQVVHMKLNADQMNDYSNRGYNIDIPVVANNLPNDSSTKGDVSNNNTRNYTDNKPTDSSNANSIQQNGSVNGDKDRWYKFWNGGNTNGGTYADEQVYKAIAQDGGGWGNDPTSKKDSNRVGVQIRKIKYNVHQYDYGSSEGQFIPDNWGKDGHNDQDYDESYDDGDLQNFKGYGLEGDTVPIHILKNAHPDGNSDATYRFGYGNQNNVYPTLGVNNSSFSSKYDKFSQSFYKPYVLPTIKINDYGRFMVNTDKPENGLPYRLDLNTDSYLFRKAYFNQDLGDDKVQFYVTYNGQRVPLSNGSDSVEKPVTDFFDDTPHGKEDHEIKGLLDTRGLGLSKGQKVNLSVHVGIVNPDHDSVSGINTNTYAFTASQDDLKGSDFKKNGKTTASITKPERTIKYFTDDEYASPRIQNERLELHQDHKGATAKTGLGIRSNFSIDYFGHINAKNYGYNGTDTDYAFPSIWANKDNDIQYHSNPYQNDDTTNFDGNKTATNYSGNANRLDGHDVSVNDWNKDKREHNTNSRFTPSTYNVADMADRLTHVNSDTKFNPGDVPSDLDTINSSNDPETYRDVDKHFGGRFGLQDNGMPSQDSAGHFATDFQFYPRAIVRDTGVAKLAHDEENLNSGNSNGAEDSLSASNKDSVNHDNVVTGSRTDRFYTPFWLPLGYYNTSFEKAMPSNNTVGGHGHFNGNVDKAPTASLSSDSFSRWYDNSTDKRLGGNFFNYEDNMLDQMVGHEYLADGSKSENNDEISIQPVLGGNGNNPKNTNGQKVEGFSNKANDWVNFKNTWQNFFN